MYTRILIFFLVGGLLAVRTEETKSVDGRLNFRRPHDDIFIDDAQADLVEGSAAVTDLDEEASGIGPDDEDTFEGSGGVEGSGVARGRTIVELPKVVVPEVYPITPAPTKKSETPKLQPELSTETPPKVTKVTTTKTYTTEATTTTPPPSESTTRKPKAPDRPVGGERPHSGEDPAVNRQPEERTTTSFFSQPGILAAIIGGAVVGLLCAILLVMFIVYRMRKKDEGSYVLDEPRRSPRNTSYHPANKDSKEFFA